MLIIVEKNPKSWKNIYTDEKAFGVLGLKP